MSIGSLNSIPLINLPLTSSFAQRSIHREKQEIHHFTYKFVHLIAEMEWCGSSKKVGIVKVKEMQKKISCELMKHFRLIKGKNSLGMNVSKEGIMRIYLKIQSLRNAIQKAPRTEFTNKLTAQIDKLTAYSLLPVCFFSLKEHFNRLPESIKIHMGTYLSEQNGLDFIRNQIDLHSLTGIPMLMNFIKFNPTPLHKLELDDVEIQGLSHHMAQWPNISKYVLCDKDAHIFCKILEKAFSATPPGSRREEFTKELSIFPRVAIIATVSSKANQIAARRFLAEFISCSPFKGGLQTSGLEALFPHLDLDHIPFIPYNCRDLARMPAEFRSFEARECIAKIFKANPQIGIRCLISYVNQGARISIFQDLGINLTSEIKAQITFLNLHGYSTDIDSKKKDRPEAIRDFIGSFPNLQHLDLDGLKPDFLPPNCQQLLSLD